MIMTPFEMGKERHRASPTTERRAPSAPTHIGSRRRSASVQGFYRGVGSAVRLGLIVFLLFGLSLPTPAQSKRRQRQIRDLLKRSDLVVLAVSRAYYPIINLIKYQREREGRGAAAIRRRARYTYGTVYRLTIKEVLFQKPSKNPDKPRRTFYPEDTLLVYVPGPPAHPLEMNRATFLPGTEYLVFLERARLSADHFRFGVKQDVNAPMRDWEPFPHPAETYFKVVPDPLAVKPMDGVWRKLAEHTRTVARQFLAKKNREH